MKKTASKDDNNVSSCIAVLNTDGSTITPLQADPTTHALKLNNGTTGSDNGPKNSRRDDNFVTSISAVSSADNETPVVLYADSSGSLLIQST